MTRWPGRGYSWKIMAGCLLLAALLRLPSLNLSLDRDEGEYATLAQQWSRGQALPYRDLADLKPPLVPLLDRMSYFFGSESAFSVRGLALAWQLAATAVFYLLIAGGLGRMEGLTATVLFLVASCGARIQGLAANAESFTSLPLMLGLLALKKIKGPDSNQKAEDAENNAARRWFLFGLGAGLAGLAKQPALAAAAVFPLFLCLGPGSKAKALAWTACGALIPWALAAGYFSAQGALGDMYYCLVIYPSRYAGGGWSGFLGNAFAALRILGAEQGGLWAMAALGLLAGTWKERRFFLAWLSVALLGCGMTGRFYPHYFTPLAAPLAGAACLGLKPLWQRGRAWGSGGKIVAAACLLMFLAGWLRTTSGIYMAADAGERSSRIYGLKVFADAPEAAKLVERADPGGRTLWIWGSEAELYFLTGRKPASRFLFHYPFNGEAPDWPGGTAELLLALKDPGLKAVAMPLISTLDPRQPLQAEINRELLANFVPAGRTDQFVVGIRKPGPGMKPRTPVKNGKGLDESE